MNIREMQLMKNQKAQEYMNKTYGTKFDDEFELVNAEYAGFASKADSFIMSSKKFNDFYVRVSYFEDKYTTDYMEFVYYKQYQQYMQAVAGKSLGECKVLLDFTLCPSQVYNQDTDFKEFLTTKRTLKSLIVFIENDEDLEKRVLTLLEDLKQKDVPLGSIRFVTMKNYEAAKAFDNKNDWGRYKKKDNNQSLLKYYDYGFNRDYEIRRKSEGEYR